MSVGMYCERLGRRPQHRSGRLPFGADRNALPVAPPQRSRPLPIDARPTPQLAKSGSDACRRDRSDDESARIWHLTLVI